MNQAEKVNKDSFTYVNPGCLASPDGLVIDDRELTLPLTYASVTRCPGQLSVQ